jgi:cyclophilin family peptidyl-prolyl cis-trans isomerase
MKQAFWVTALFALLLTPSMGCSQMNGNQENGDTESVKFVEVETRFGSIAIWPYKATPKHRKNFLKLARKGFYDSTTFHRIIDGFMIQGGDPNTKMENPKNIGKGGPGYKLEAEIIDSLKHDYGAVAAARKSDRVNPERKSSGSQFYIVENKQGTHQLDGKYTVFGKVIKGMDVVEEIAAQPTAKRNRPQKPIPMQVEVKEMGLQKLKKQYDYQPPP